MSSTLHLVVFLTSLSHLLHPAYANDELGPKPATDCPKAVLSTLINQSPEKKVSILNPKQGLLGKMNLKPDSIELAAFRTEISSLQKFEQFPTIEITELNSQKSWEKLPAGGQGNEGMYLTQQGEKDILIKRSKPKQRSESTVLNEARMLMYLNKMGIGPEFYGLVRIPETGGLALAMQPIKGVPTSSPLLLKDFKITDRMIQKVIDTGKKLKKAGIDYAPDMQFILTPTTDGILEDAVLIDPEFFSFKVQSKIGLPHDPVGNTEKIADMLQRTMDSQQKLRQNKTP